MNAIEQLASALGRKDEVPNVELAERIVEADDKKAVRQLVENLKNKEKGIQSDCVKTLYEIGERKPKLLAPYTEQLLALLEDKNNRLVWGGMMALDTIALEDPKSIYAALPKILSVAEGTSVIARDHCVRILAKLASLKQYADDMFPLLIEQLLRAPTNQFPMYAELTLPIITDANRDLFVQTLTSRLHDVEQESKRKRIEKVMKKVGSGR